MIRSVTPDDVPAILTLIRDLATYERAPHEVINTAEELHRHLFSERPALFGHVAEHEGEIAGFALWFLNYSTWKGRHGVYLEDLYVRPELRGHGYGRLLLRELARTAHERGYARVEWNVLDWNEPAIGFYKSLGAEAMTEWTTFRLTGDALRALACEG